MSLLCVPVIHQHWRDLFITVYIKCVPNQMGDSMQEKQSRESGERLSRHYNNLSKAWQSSEWHLELLASHSQQLIDYLGRKSGYIHLDSSVIFADIPHKRRRYILLYMHETVSRVNHMLGHKTSVNRLERFEIIKNMFSKHNSLKLDANNRRKLESSPHTRKVNRTLPNNLFVK